LAKCNVGFNPHVHALVPEIKIRGKEVKDCMMRIKTVYLWFIDVDYKSDL